MFLDFELFLANHTMRLLLPPQKLPYIGIPKNLLMQGMPGDTIIIKLKERFSDCTNEAVARKQTK